jgi:hypothetical protein
LHDPEEAAAVPVFDANIDGRVEGIGCDPLKERLPRRFRLTSSERSSEIRHRHLGAVGENIVCRSGWISLGLISLAGSLL